MPLLASTAAILGLAFGAAGATSALGDGLLLDTWTTNGSVEAIVRDGGKLYIGGAFTVLSPRSGTLIGFSDDLRRKLEWSERDDPVLAAATDGAGGSFVSFDTTTGTESHSTVQHLGGDGALDPSFRVEVDGSVTTLVRSGDHLYLAGGFRAVDGQARRNAAAVSTGIGSILPWNPRPNRYVGAVAVTKYAVFLGGEFTHVGSAKRSELAAVNRATGRALRWHADVRAKSCFCNTGYEPWVGALYPRGRTLYVGGYFDHIRGVRRESAAAVDTVSGRVKRWHPRLGHVSEGSPAVSSIIGDARHVYVGGDAVRGDTPVPLRALDPTTGRRIWTRRLGDVDIWTLTRNGRELFVGGYRYGNDFDPKTVAAAPGGLLRAVDTATGRVLAWNPRPNGVVTAVIAAKDVFVGGFFSGLGGVARVDLASLDETTGAPTRWNPRADNWVTTLAAADGTIYVGGIFKRIGGVKRENLAAVDGATGAPTAWRPANAIFGPDELVVTDQKVFIPTDGPARKPGLFAFDRTSGASTQIPVTGGARRIRGLALVGSTLYVAGSFTGIGGVSRAGLAAIDANTNAVLPWNPGGPGDWTAIDVTGSSTVVGRSTGELSAEVASIKPDGSRRWQAVLTMPRILDPDTGEVISQPQVHDLVQRNGLVFIAGMFKTIAGLERTHVAALDTATGAVQPWGPRIDPVNAEIGQILVEDSSVVLGGIFNRAEGHWQHGIARLVGAPGVTP